MKEETCTEKYSFTHPMAPGQAIALLRAALRGPAGNAIPVTIQKENQLSTATIILEEIYPAPELSCASQEK